MGKSEAAIKWAREHGIPVVDITIQPPFIPSDMFGKTTISPRERLSNSIRTMNVRIRTCADERERRALIAVRDAMRDTLAQ